MKDGFPRKDLVLRMLSWLPLRVDDVEVKTVLTCLLTGLQEKWVSATMCGIQLCVLVV